MKYAGRQVFRLSKKHFLTVFLVFLAKERPIVTALSQMILDEIKQSNGIKPPKKSTFS